jgi:uncharacterized protein YutE (UPF0331/DUF86 family)/predicted nucleotidyltransferase
MEPIKTWRVHEEEKGRVEERLAGALAGEPDVVFAYLHGSFVEGEVFRDIDVAVFLDPFPTPAWPREAELAARLEATLRRAGLPFPVDVRALNAAPPAFRFAAIRPRRILLCRDEGRRADFEASTWTEYFEVRRLHEAYLRGVFQMIRYQSDRMRNLLSALFESQRALDSLARMPEADFLADPHRRASARYHLVLAAEAIVDIAQHLIAQNRWRPPETYSEALQVLQEHGVLHEALAQRLSDLIRMRHRLVHRYWEVDDRLVFQAIPQAMQDIEDFVQAIGVATGLRSGK